VTKGCGVFQEKDYWGACRVMERCVVRSRGEVGRKWGVWISEERKSRRGKDEATGGKVERSEGVKGVC